MVPCCRVPGANDRHIAAGGYGKRDPKEWCTRIFLDAEMQVVYVAMRGSVYGFRVRDAERIYNWEDIHEVPAADVCVFREAGTLAVGYVHAFCVPAGVHSSLCFHLLRCTEWLGLCCPHLRSPPVREMCMLSEVSGLRMTWSAAAECGLSCGASAPEQPPHHWVTRHDRQGVLPFLTLQSSCCTPEARMQIDSLQTEACSAAAMLCYFISCIPASTLFSAEQPTSRASCPPVSLFVDLDYLHMPATVQPLPQRAA